MHYHHIHFKEIDSTNIYLKNSYKLLNDFTFVSADYQSGGKGRNDRTWISNHGENLMFSFLIKNQELTKKYNYLSIYTAIEVARIIESHKIGNVSIKWPNDVLICDKKVCGILLEGQILEYIVIGVGLNVNQKEFPSGLRRPATSLSLEAKKDIDIEKLREKLFNQIVNGLSNFDERSCFEYLSKHNYLLNKKVRVTVNNNPFVGEVVGIDEDFFLQVRTNDMLIHIDSGEIEIL